MGAVRAGILTLALLAGSLCAAGAQEEKPAGGTLLQSPILTIDQDRLFSESLWGKRVAQRIESASADLAAENRRIEAELTSEEENLTELRKTKPADEFRDLANAFDAKVTEFRRAQDGKARTISRIHEVERQKFFGAALPVIAEVLRRHGAIVVLDNRAIFLAADAIDATDEMIARIDSEVGAGQDADVAPDTPEAGAVTPGTGN